MDLQHVGAHDLRVEFAALACRLLHEVVGVFQAEPRSANDTAERVDHLVDVFVATKEVQFYTALLITTHALTYLKSMPFRNAADGSLTQYDNQGNFTGAFRDCSVPDADKCCRTAPCHCYAGQFAVNRTFPNRTREPPLCQPPRVGN